MPDLEVVEGGAPQPAPKKYFASIYPTNEEVPADFAEMIFKLEKALECQIWCLIQQGEDNFDEMGHVLYAGFLKAKEDIVPKSRIGLLVHSPGGHISAAYKIVRLFQRRTDEFFTIVPLYAKSAATLMAIGGKEIVMGSEAELGPLDVQLWNEDTEEFNSALDAVQAFERLNTYALTAFDQAILLFMRKTRKKPIALMQPALHYATSIIAPLADKIDTIELTRKSRELKVAEEYAKRVMRGYYPPAQYIKIASALVERYPTHGFAIGRNEAGNEWGTTLGVSGKVVSLGLNVTRPSSEVEHLFTSLTPYLLESTIIGRITEAGS
jgi:hypothetical protein